MGTRGFIGFVIDGQEKIGYNHWDSYPSGLGMEVLTWLKEMEKDGVEWYSYVRNLKVIDPAVEPTTEQIKDLLKWSDLDVSERSLKDWYCLLRKTHGDPGAMLAAGYVADSSEFPLDSLFAEWGYVIDVDTQTFEVYEGFQKEPHHRGRFAHRGLSEDTERRIANGSGVYYPVALRAAWSFNALPTGEEFLAVLTDLEEDE